MEFVEASFATRTFCCWLAFLVVSDFFSIFGSVWCCCGIYFLCFLPSKKSLQKQHGFVGTCRGLLSIQTPPKRTVCPLKKWMVWEDKNFLFGFHPMFFVQTFFRFMGRVWMEEVNRENHEVLDSNCWIYQLELGCCVKESFNSNWQCFGILTHFTHGPGPVFSRMSRWPSPGDSSCDLFGAPVSVKMVTPKFCNPKCFNFWYPIFWWEASAPKGGARFNHWVASRSFSKGGFLQYMWAWRRKTKNPEKPQKPANHHRDARISWD